MEVIINIAEIRTRDLPHPRFKFDDLDRSTTVGRPIIIFLKWIFFKKTIFFFFSETMCGYYEKKLLNDLIVDYNALERPVVNESEPLLLTFGVTLQQIIDVVSNMTQQYLFRFWKQRED